MAKPQVNRPVSVPTEGTGVGTQVNRPVSPPNSADSPRDTRRDQPVVPSRVGSR